MVSSVSWGSALIVLALVSEHVLASGIIRTPPTPMFGSPGQRGFPRDSCLSSEAALRAIVHVCMRAFAPLCLCLCAWAGAGAGAWESE